MFIIQSWEKLNDFINFFTYLFSFAQGGKYSPIPIHQKVFNDLLYFHKVKKLKIFERETGNCEWIHFQKVRNFWDIFYLRNGKYVGDFINNNIFLFHTVYSFFPWTSKVSKQGILFARNWKCCLKVEKNNKYILLY